jgi:predicted O-methyltransferase YrrM
LHNQFCTLDGFDTFYDKVLHTYSELGYSSELVTHWALPRRDARKLLEQIIDTQPTQILEIGTFVGLTTLLMAVYTPAKVMIHTVDPNFPLAVELGAMHTQTGDADLNMRQQELGSRAARQLGLDHKIRFHAGGFSTGVTFASAKQDPRNRVPLIGPEICAAYGPFDFIFIDGLHYTDALLSDLRLAHHYLGSGGRIVVHDVIGCWGSNVRRAVFRFLAETPGLSFHHARYADIYDSIGVLQHTSQGGINSGATSVESLKSQSLLDQPEFVSNLATIVVNICAPQSVVYLGPDRAGILSRLADFGVKDLLQINFSETYRPPCRFDLCISLGDGDRMDERQRQHLVESCVQCSDAILFGATPPGETAIASPGAQPIEWWVREFWKHGYRFHDVVRPNLEPFKFAYSYSPIYPVTSSELANLYLIRRESSANSNLAQMLEQVLVEKENRIEDLSLQGVFGDILLQDTLKKYKQAQDLMVEMQAQIAQQNTHLQHYERIGAHYVIWITERLKKVINQFT